MLRGRRQPLMALLHGKFLWEREFPESNYRMKCSAFSENYMPSLRKRCHSRYSYNGEEVLANKVLERPLIRSSARPGGAVFSLRYNSTIAPAVGTSTVHPNALWISMPKPSAVSSSPCTTKVLRGGFWKCLSQAINAAWSACAESPPNV